MKGFTLVEVVIVVVMLLIIFMIAAPPLIKHSREKETQTVEIVDKNRPTITRSE